MNPALFPLEELPIITPPGVAVTAQRKVWVAVYHKLTGKIAQTVMVLEGDAHRQHLLWGGHHYAEVPAGTHPNLHAIDVKTGRVIDKDRTEQIAAEKARDARYAIADKITGGFLSKALGDWHEYGSNMTEQHNLLITAQVGGSIMCEQGGVWELRPHTPAQALAVLADFVAHRDAARAGH